jgi:hypothetical protein
MRLTQGMADHLRFPTRGSKGDKAKSVSPLVRTLGGRSRDSHGLSSQSARHVTHTPHMHKRNMSQVSQPSPRAIISRAQVRGPTGPVHR